MANPAENDIHVRITQSDDLTVIVCRGCGEELLRAKTGNEESRRQAAWLGWQICAGHVCGSGGTKPEAGGKEKP